MIKIGDGKKKRMKVKKKEERINEQKQYPIYIKKRTKKAKGREKNNDPIHRRKKE